LLTAMADAAGVSAEPEQVQHANTVDAGIAKLKAKGAR